MVEHYHYPGAGYQHGDGGHEFDLVPGYEGGLGSVLAVPVAVPPSFALSSALLETLELFALQTFFSLTSESLLCGLLFLNLNGQKGSLI